MLSPPSASSAQPSPPPQAFSAAPPLLLRVRSTDFRKLYKEKHPKNKSVAAVGKAVGDKWKSMYEKENAPYIAKIEQRKENYNRQMEDYD
nr:HMG1/2-like protein [Ipomoea trifida]